VLRTFATPILNMCLADNSGSIGYEFIGRLPKRAGSEDRLMLSRDGSDPSQDWQGFMNAADVASVSNPPRGYVVSANDPPTRNRAIPISDVWETSARADRIAQLIEQTGRINTAGATKILMDVTSPFDRDLLLPLLLEQYPDPDPVTFQPDSTWQYRFDSLKHIWKWDSLQHHTSLNDSVVKSMIALDSASMHRIYRDSTIPHYKDKTLASALEYLRNWDGAMRSDETAPMIYAVFLQTLMKNTFRDELGADRYSEFAYLSNIILNSLERLLGDPENIWWDDINTPNIVEDRDTIIKITFAETLHILKTTFGPDLRLWQWGRLHTLTYHHQFEAAGGSMAKMVNVETGPAPGGLTTVSQAAYDMWNPYEMRVGPSMRFLADMKTQTLLASLPTGNSEAVFGAHYRDMVDLFKAGGYDAIPLDRRDASWMRFELLPAQ
jgi:acyl-homoserine lactone acylase PvdQ